MEHYLCPNCKASIQPMRRTRDFFCRGCYTSLVVIDDHWVQMMRASDKIPQTIPFSSLERELKEAKSMKADCRSLTGPLS
jgi:reverse gyrase